MLNSLAIILNRLWPPLRRLAPILVTLGLLGWTWHKGLWDGSVLSRLLTPQGWISGVLIHFLILTLASVRFWLLAKGMIPLSYAILGTFWGVFWGFLVPVGGIGVDAFRVAFLRRLAQKPLKNFVFIATLDRMVGLMTLCLWVLWGMIQSLRLRQFLGTWSYFVIMLIIFSWAVWVLGLKWWNPDQSWRQLWRRYRKRWLLITIVSALSQGLSIAFFGFVSHWILGHASLPWTELLVFIPLGFLLMAIPVSPQGLGVGQMSFYWIFEKFLMAPGSLGVALVSGYQFFHFFVSFVVSLLYLIFQGVRSLPHAKKIFLSPDSYE